MTLRPLALASALCLALSPGVHAGDAATDNLPGGAVQAPVAGAMVSQLNALPPPMIAPGGEPPPTASGTMSAPASAIGSPSGSITVTTTGGRSFSTASPFIGRVLNFYAGPHGAP